MAKRSKPNKEKGAGTAFGPPAPGKAAQPPASSPDESAGGAVNVNLHHTQNNLTLIEGGNDNLAAVLNPGFLEALAKVVPNGPEILMGEVVTQAEHRRRIELLQTEGALEDRKSERGLQSLGQVAAVIAMTAMILGIGWCASHGGYAAAGILSGAVLLVVTTFVTGRSARVGPETRPANRPTPKSASPPPATPSTKV